jgi:hypothetical protein
MRYFKFLKTLLNGARLAHSIRIDIILFGKNRILQFGVRAPNYIECGDSAKISKIRRPTNTYADHNSRNSKLRAEDPPSAQLKTLTRRVPALCIYSYRSRIKHRRNLRFEPLFSEGFDFAYLVGPTRTDELVRLLGIWLPIHRLNLPLSKTLVSAKASVNLGNPCPYVAAKSPSHRTSLRYVIEAPKKPHRALPKVVSAGRMKSEV